MGECPSCGKKGWFLKTKKCMVCGKEGCDKCFPLLMEVRWSVPRVRMQELLHVCSTQCYETFAKRIEKEITPSRIPLNAPKHFLGKFVTLALCANKYHISKELSKTLKNKSYTAEKNGRGLQLQKLDSKLHTRFERILFTIKAETLEEVGRFEEAAKIYEWIGMFKKAGKARAKDRQVAVRRTEVSVDLNSLLKQIRDGGIVAVYRCPHCGGKLKVGKETSVKSLKVCGHCGSEIKAMELADFLKTALS